MPSRCIRSGVRTTISFLTRQIVAAKQTIARAKVEIGRLKRVDKRVRRLRTTAIKKVKRTAVVKRSVAKGLTAVDLAYLILAGRKRPLDLATLAARVLAKKKGGRRTGLHFPQNLGMALVRDERFVRVGRGVYGLRAR